MTATPASSASLNPHPKFIYTQTASLPKWNSTFKTPRFIVRLIQFAFCIIAIVFFLNSVLTSVDRLKTVDLADSGFNLAILSCFTGMAVSISTLFGFLMPVSHG